MAYSLPCTSHEASSHVGLQTTLSSKRKVSEMSRDESESEDELHQLNIPKYVELERPEPEFIPEPWLVDTPRSKQKKPKPVIISPSVADSLDRTKTSDRSATYVLASTAQSLGHDVGKMTLSRQSIRRSRMKFRKIIAERIKADFSPNHPLTIHWDGKMMADIVGKEVVDRLPIIVSGGESDQLLVVAKLAGGGTGEQMATAICNTIDEWGIGERIRAMCFDTTSSNTGCRNGACVLLEQNLEKELLYFACRHHIHELILEAVFSVCMRVPTSGPDVQLFKRFQNQWQFIDQDNFDHGLLDMGFNATTVADIVHFCKDQLEKFQPRDDYREFLELTIIILGGIPKRGIRFIAPGALHRARWMAKAIYSLKIWLFRSQFTLTRTEVNGIKSLNSWLIRYYVKSWFLSRCAISAPAHDLKWLKELDALKSDQPDISKASLKKLSGHLRYLSEEQVAIAFFDDKVSTETKRKMVQGLNIDGEEEPPKRITIDQSAIHAKNLEDFVSSNTRRFFQFLHLPSEFLKNDPTEWDSIESFCSARDIVKNLRVVNDNAERGVSLMNEYNKLITNDEEQKQYLLQAVSEHRRQFPDCAKKLLLE